MDQTTTKKKKPQFPHKINKTTLPNYAKKLKSINNDQEHFNKRIGLCTSLLQLRRLVAAEIIATRVDVGQGGGALRLEVAFGDRVAPRDQGLALLQRANSVPEDLDARVYLGLDLGARDRLSHAYRGLRGRDGLV